MKKLLILIIASTLLFTACSNTPMAPKTSEATPSQPVTQSAIISLADLAKHSTQTDCWSAVRWDVYDLSGAFGKHPGGDEAILKLCGKDGTSAFEWKHGGQENPERALASMPKTGKLQ